MCSKIVDNKVCCLVLNYNDYKTTLSLLDEIENYTCFDKIVVVDNKSNNESYSVLKQRENNRVFVISTNSNQGYGAGNNYGIRWILDNSDSKYALICNPDVHFKESLVPKMIHLAEIKNAALVSCMMTNPRGEKQTSCVWKVPTKNEFILNKGHLLSSIFHLKEKTRYQKGDFRKEILEVECIAGSYFLANIEILENIGMFDEDMFLYCEETTLGFRLKKAGFKNYLITNDTYIHEHAVSVSRTFGTNFKGWVKPQIIWIKSANIFLRKYLCCNRVTILWANLFFYFATVERFFIYKALNLKKGVQNAIKEKKLIK